MLKYGAFFSQETRDGIIKAANEDASSLFLQPHIRKLFMLDLAEKVANHSPGKITHLAGDVNGFLDSTPTVRRIYVAITQELDDVVDRMMSVAQFHGYTFDPDKLCKLLQKIDALAETRPAES